MLLAISFSNTLFVTILRVKIFIWASLDTFIPNYSILENTNILFILELKFEFRDL